MNLFKITMTINANKYLKIQYFGCHLMKRFEQKTQLCQARLKMNVNRIRTIRTFRTIRRWCNNRVASALPGPGRGGLGVGGWSGLQADNLLATWRTDPGRGLRDVHTSPGVFFFWFLCCPCAPWSPFVLDTFCPRNLIRLRERHNERYPILGRLIGRGLCFPIHFIGRRSIKL